MVNRTGGRDDSATDDPTADEPAAQGIDGDILDCTGLSLAELRETEHPVLRSVLARLSVRVLSSEEVLAGFQSSV